MKLFYKIFLKYFGLTSRLTRSLGLFLSYNAPPCIQTHWVYLFARQYFERGNDASYSAYYCSKRDHSLRIIKNYKLVWSSKFYNYYNYLELFVNVLLHRRFVKENISRDLSILIKSDKKHNVLIYDLLIFFRQ